jgi:hypothetical protein
MLNVIMLSAECRYAEFHGTLQVSNSAGSFRNIGLGWKNLIRANALAYLVISSMSKKFYDSVGSSQILMKIKICLNVDVGPIL